MIAADIRKTPRPIIVDGKPEIDGGKDERRRPERLNDPDQQFASIAHAANLVQVGVVQAVWQTSAISNALLMPCSSVITDPHPVPEADVCGDPDGRRRSARSRQARARAPRREIVVIPRPRESCYRPGGRWTHDSCSNSPPASRRPRDSTQPRRSCRGRSSRWRAARLRTAPIQP